MFIAADFLSVMHFMKDSPQVTIHCVSFFFSS